MLSAKLTSLKDKLEKSFDSPTLTVELVPKPLWRLNGPQLVGQANWNKLRKIVYKKASYLCEICGGRGPKHPVDCHEIWRYDDENHIQQLIRLIALCPSCHQVKHIGRAIMRNRGATAIAHLAQMNDWTKAQTDEYLRLVSSIWRERCKHQWQQNLTWLEQFGISVAPTK